MIASKPQNPSVEIEHTVSHSTSMADSVISLDKLKAIWHSQIHDEEKWALNVKLLRAAGLFAGSIFLMRNYGDLMAI
ncbi:mitochondrial import receptor subunit TOM5 homolog [Mangifera indica]|uniref:mitochondrial import receptor subunit TOM5 homolog n=1 Tax=Mangifera indica TaxID=29780 RepID=UPI001CFA9574|nr:mitochondrial import receptor subunit TOM5 homolog [Mangifera indica]